MRWREYRLQLLLVARTVGVLPVASLAVWAALCALQEPAFFREQGIQVLWASIYALADIWGLAAVCVWWSRIRALPGLTLRPGTSGLVLSTLPLALALAAAVFGAVADALRGLSDLRLPLHGVARAVLVWWPVAWLAAALSAVPPTLASLAVLAGAGLMLAIHPVSAVAGGPTIATVIASAVAVGGALLAAGRRS